MSPAGPDSPRHGAAPVPRPGDRAPDLVLPDQYGEPTSLAEAVQDRAALLVFFPFAFSAICTGELLEVQLDIDRFSNDRVQVHGISCDSTYALRVWAAQEGYRFPLLSDFWPHGEVCRAFGVLDEESGHPVRGTFLVGTDQKVIWSLVHGPEEERPIGLLHEAVALL
ncbi:peroxiredoxin [Ornithinimicrobium humiphilum]|uniref:Peroxiredoxin (Alkyl hydroperoxide reductase subunit C) n=1 Tax=Ornithinimicrobium humiphilum TaxID=125288 RepID=A0A543KPV6_9MICO|nr:redoxin domain-containing protein [Ornithinimicrobium humiphilum]TQM97098.1 peroxiredoxin (alkyl hydroperoxide reductase subunit C) [Ornithinimicrobium humiphilum]